MPLLSNCHLPGRYGLPSSTLVHPCVHSALGFVSRQLSTYLLGANLESLVISEARRGDGPESSVTIQRPLKPLSIRPYVSQRIPKMERDSPVAQICKLSIQGEITVLRDVTFRSVGRC
jgi:hypothetical protein